MTRIRAGAAALAVGLLLAGCGPDSVPTGSAGSTGATQAASGDAGSDGGNGSQGEPDGGGRWCAAVKEFTAAVDPLFGQDSVGDQGDVDRARARLTELKAAAPVEIKPQVADLGEFYAAVIDSAGRSMAGDPAAYARIGETVTKVETAMPPVSEYTMKNCPGLTEQLPAEVS